MAATAPPTLTVGLGLTVRILFAEVIPHKPPAVVSVNVTDAGAAAAAVYVVAFGVNPPLFVNEPPAPPSDHTADVALPPYEPCLLYTSDAADEEDSVDLGGRR